MQDQFAGLDAPVIMHPPYNQTGAYIGQTLRLGGASTAGYASFNLASHVDDEATSIIENWERLSFATEHQWNRSSLATCNQVHGDEILIVTKGGHHDQKADALISTQPGCGIGIFTADCVPVVIVNPQARVVGVAHCGWRGAKLKLASKTANRILQLSSGDKQDLFVWLGASIAQANYEVGPEVAACFSESFHISGNNDRRLLDVAGAVGQELLDIGILKDNLIRNTRDTFGEQGLFFSYRRDGIKTGRMLTFAGFPVRN